MKQKHGLTQIVDRVHGLPQAVPARGATVSCLAGTATAEETVARVRTNSAFFSSTLCFQLKTGVAGICGSRLAERRRTLRLAGAGCGSFRVDEAAAWSRAKSPLRARASAGDTRAGSQCEL